MVSGYPRENIVAIAAGFVFLGLAGFESKPRPTSPVPIHEDGFGFTSSFEGTAQAVTSGLEVATLPFAFMDYLGTFWTPFFGALGVVAAAYIWAKAVEAVW